MDHLIFFIHPNGNEYIGEVQHLPRFEDTGSLTFNRVRRVEYVNVQLPTLPQGGIVVDSKIAFRPISLCRPSVESYDFSVRDVCSGIWGVPTPQVQSMYYQSLQSTQPTTAASRPKVVPQSETDGDKITERKSTAE